MQLNIPPLKNRGLPLMTEQRKRKKRKRTLVRAKSADEYAEEMMKIALSERRGLSVLRQPPRQDRNWW